MPIFTFPLAFIGLLAIPALIAIYWLRNRAREQKVSSLLLWLDEKQRWDGGRKIQRLQTPLLFFLELLAIILLTTAAAGPMMRAGESERPLIVVLDDSFSMLAGNADSARSRAVAAIEKELRDNRNAQVRFVLAGESPQLLGEAAANSEQAIKLLQEWRCAQPAAKLDEAIAFAFELGGKRVRVLALTDHAPAQEPSESRLQWWAFGQSRPNLAFVNAARTERDGQQLVLLEIANLSAQPKTTTLAIESNNPQSISLTANETRRITLRLKADAPALRARLSDDALNVDNEVVLLPEANRVVRVDLRVRDAALRALVEKAVQSAKNALIAQDRAGLIMTDDGEVNASNAESWTLQIIAERDASSFLGPFVIDRAHPLSEGLSLGGVIWGSGKSQQFAGAPIILAGNTPLLTDVERSGSHQLRLRLRPDLSTLPETPNWPILFWNLINWRARTAPGLREANLRMGTDATLIVESGVQSVSVKDPQNNIRQIPTREGAVTIKAQAAGVYDLSAGQNRYVFVVNALQREESDLTNAMSGRWGNWAKSSEFQWEYRRIGWLLLLFGLIALVVHQWLVKINPRD